MIRTYEPPVHSLLKSHMQEIHLVIEMVYMSALPRLASELQSTKDSPLAHPGMASMCV